MKSVKYLGSAALIALAIASLALNSGCKRKSTGPNVVLIVIDTLRADHLPFYGYGENTAPFLASLASRGAVFENAVSASSWTAPATTSIFTSLYPFQHGVVTGIMASDDLQVNVSPIPESIVTLPELLREKGYKTYCVANNPNICETEGFSRGFDRFANFLDAQENKMTVQLENWAGEIKKQEKYFLYIHYNDCHHPYSRNDPWFKKKKTKRDNVVSRYDSEISFVDFKISKLYDLLGWNENTLVIVTADHGEEFWDHHGEGHGATLYSEVIRVPLLFFFPGRDGMGKRIKTNVSTLDILPTIRSYLGIKSRQVEEGMSLLPVINGEKRPARERYIFSHLLVQEPGRPRACHRATINRERKFIFVDELEAKTRRELFDLGTDPGEQTNILENNQPLASLLFAKYVEFEKRSKKFTSKTRKMRLNKEKMDELKTLGYVQ